MADMAPVGHALVAVLALFAPLAVAWCIVRWCGRKAPGHRRARLGRGPDVEMGVSAAKAAHERRPH
ncbi:hypothetical protein [Paracidovorax anthurii]|uniref:hypothetical protein n=1 Tax=Paracidovorax anthurii TaxID=78229 RepID=UPI0011BEE59E|nr:hypothetical protein [Paracidovorax anthurii]WCM93532.1 hypothetical protein M5C99_01995 [Acidovorax sp. NCPPB 2350]